MFDEQPDGDPHGECAAEIHRLQAVILEGARRIEALKRDCGMDPQSPTAIQNARYMGVSMFLRAALSPPIAVEHGL